MMLTLKDCVLKLWCLGGTFSKCDINVCCVMHDDSPKGLPTKGAFFFFFSNF